MTIPHTTTIALTDGLQKIINYPIITGNPLWRFLILLLVVLAAVAAGRIVQYAITNYALRREKKRGVTAMTLLLKCLAKPSSVVIFALGLHVCKLCLVFEDKTTTPPMEGISTAVQAGWTRIAQAIVAIAVAYALYRLVDIVEHYLLRWTSKTETKLDDMLVPVVRKALRITTAIVAAIYIIDNILKQDVQSILLGAGVGGIAIAFAAKDTIANFLGSVTIFADRPFQMGEVVQIGEHRGPVEEVGFRSTRIRTKQGHLVTVPNSVIVNSVVENISRRPFIRRISNITITYDSSQQGAKRAVEIIKEVLSQVPQINTDPEKPPRVYFSDFSDWALNIYMSYWVKPPDYWLYHEVNQRINLEIMKRFEAEKIEFAFPSQTLYLKKD